MTRANNSRFLVGLLTARQPGRRYAARRRPQRARLLARATRHAPASISEITSRDFSSSPLPLHPLSLFHLVLLLRWNRSVVTDRRRYASGPNHFFPGRNSSDFTLGTISLADGATTDRSIIVGIPPARPFSVFDYLSRGALQPVNGEFTSVYPVCPNNLYAAIYRVS